jgi:tetratricopeptide (TPR) repeat protein
MTEPSVWQRLKRARIVQVLAVYLGASWVVLQIAELLTKALSLPAWVLPVTVILLLVGLVVILATAWIQSMPATTAAEQAGELPTDWELAPREAISSVLRGRLPHLTWARAITGGVVVLALLFGGTGLYVGITGGPLTFSPAEITASEVPEGIAVIPFAVRGGDDLEIWREGMMDLLTNNLDGVGGFRTIDTRTVMARWKQHVGDAVAPELRTALRAARATGALYALEGSVVGLGRDVRLSVNVYSLVSADKVAQGSVQGPADEVLRLVDELAVEVMRDLLRAVGRAGAGDLSADAMTTTSLPALRAFLEGEFHYRRGRFADAVQSYERAVAADTAFAIALIRLAEGYGWLESASSEQLQEYGRRAEAHADRLSPRYQFIMDGWTALNRGTADGVASLQQAVQKYPDDAGAWFLLAETYIHVGGATYATDDDIREALERAIDLDPNFAPYRAHQAHYAVLAGDRAGAEAAREAYYRLTGSRTGLEEVELAIPLLLGDSTEVEAALASPRTASERTLSIYEGTFGRRHDRTYLDLRVSSLAAAVLEQDRDQFQAYYRGMMAEIDHGAGGAATLSPAIRGLYWGHVNELWDVPPPGADDPGGTIDAGACDEPSFNHFCHLFLGMAAARWGRWGDHDRSKDRLRAVADSVREDEPARAERYDATVDVLEGTRRWRTGDRQAGRQLLERHIRRADMVGERARLELGWLEANAGRPAQAIPHFRTALNSWARPAALYGLATMHTRLGQHDQARGYYQRLVTIARQGNDDLPRLREVRETLARESGRP